MENSETVQSLNNQISYPDGKMFYILGQGYTSKLMQRLYSLGWMVWSGIGEERILKDDKGRKVTSGNSWPELLKNTAIAMR